MTTVQDQNTCNCPVCDSEVLIKNLANFGLTVDEFAILKKHRDNGISKITKVVKSMEQTKMENEIWKALIENWREILTRESNKGINTGTVRSDNQSKEKGQGTG